MLYPKLGQFHFIWPKTSQITSNYWQQWHNLSRRIQISHELYISNLHPMYSHKFLWNFHITYTAPLKSHIKTSKAATSTVYFPTLGIASTQTRRRGLGDGAGFAKAFHSPQNWCCLRCSMFVRLRILQDFQVSSNRRYTPNTSGGTSLLVLLQDWCDHLFHIFCAVTSNFLMASLRSPCLSDPRQDGTLWGPFLHCTSVYGSIHKDDWSPFKIERMGC